MCVSVGPVFDPRSISGLCDRVFALHAIRRGIAFENRVERLIEVLAVTQEDFRNARPGTAADLQQRAGCRGRSDRRSSPSRRRQISRTRKSSTSFAPSSKRRYPIRRARTKPHSAS